MPPCAREGEAAAPAPGGNKADENPCSGLTRLSIVGSNPGHWRALELIYTLFATPAPGGKKGGASMRRAHTRTYTHVCATCT